eukprot:899211_1
MGSFFSKFKKKTPTESDISAIDNAIWELEKDESFDPEAIGALQSLRRSTVILVDKSTDPSSSAWVKAKSEQEKILIQIQKDKDLAKQLNAFEKAREAKPEPLKTAIACKDVRRPEPTKITSENMEKYSLFANSGLLVRIERYEAGEVAHGSCTATLLQDGQTLVSAGHCVGFIPKGESGPFPAVFHGALAVRWCPMYSKEGHEGLEQEDLLYCPFVTEMYILKGWKETPLSHRAMRYDVAVLKLEKNIEEYQKGLMEKYGFTIGGLPFNYIQKSELEQMTDSPHQRLPAIEAVSHGVVIKHEKDLHLSLEAAPLFTSAKSYNVPLAVAGYPVESNHQLWLYEWTVYFDDLEGPEPMCLYSLCSRLRKRPGYVPGRRIVFPLKTNHGASGSSLISLDHGTIIGVLSSGNRAVSGDERTTFTVFDHQIARFIAAVSSEIHSGRSTIREYNEAIATRDDAYKIVGFRFEKSSEEGFDGAKELDLEPLEEKVELAMVMDSVYYNRYGTNYKAARYYDTKSSNHYGIIAAELIFLVVMVLCCLCVGLWRRVFLLVRNESETNSK